MRKFMVFHTMRPGGMTLDEAVSMDQATQEGLVVKGYRSFMNLSEGKAVSIYESPNVVALRMWLQDNLIDYDTISEVEYEGERGVLMEV